jgi:hypothetical protein
MGQEPGPSCTTSGCIGQVYTILLLGNAASLPNPFHKRGNLPVYHKPFLLAMHRTIVFSGRIIGEITVGFSCGLFELQQFTGGSFDVSEIVSAGDSIEMLYSASFRKRFL